MKEAVKRKLSTINFSDFYVSSDYYFLKGIPNPQNIPLWSQDKIEITDIQEIRDKLLSVFEKKQNNSFFIDHDGIRYRVQKASMTDGDMYVLRKPMYPIPSMGSLGYNENVSSYLSKKTQNGGLILISGSTGDGKTTLAYSLLKEVLETHGGFAICIENPPESPMNGHYFHKEKGHLVGECKQREVEDNDFQTPLVEALRMRPEYLFLGEIRKPNEAYEALKMCISGHCVITTIHAEDCVKSLSRLVELVKPETGEEGAYNLVADSFSLCVHQKLVGMLNAENKKIKRPQNTFLSSDMVSVASVIRGGKIEQLNNQVQVHTKNIMNGTEILK